MATPFGATEAARLVALASSSWKSTATASPQLTAARAIAATGTPFSFALDTTSHSGSWMACLKILHRCGTLFGHAARPKPGEIERLFSAVPSMWGQAVLYFSLLKDTFHVPVAQKTAATMLTLLRMRDNRSLAEWIVKTDLKPVMSGEVAMTPEMAKVYLVHLATGGQWLEAANLMANRELLQRRPGSVATLLRSIASVRSVEVAEQARLALRKVRDNRINRSRTTASANWARNSPDFSLRETWASPDLVVAPNQVIMAMLRTLRGPEAYDRCRFLLAEILATGAPLTLTHFAPIADIMIRRGLWNVALETVVDRFQAISHGLQRQPVGITVLIMNALWCIDPYHSDARDEFVRFHSAHLDGSPSTTFYRKRYHLMFPQTLFDRFRGILVPVSRATVDMFPDVQFYHGPSSSLAERAMAAGDAVVVLDTNVILHCCQRNVPISQLLADARERLPGLRGKRLVHLVVPFTVVLELQRAVRDAYSKLGARRLIWQRIIALLSTASVLSFPTEFTCVVFQAVSRLAMTGSSNTRPRVWNHGKRNPDEIIVNVCLSLQLAARKYRVTAATHERIPTGIHFTLFLRYHLRRMTGNYAGTASLDSSVVLFTFDRALSRKVDALGIATYPP